MRRFERWPMQPPRAAQIDIRLIDRRHLDLWREARQYLKDFLRILAIARRLPFDEDCLRAQSRGRTQRHCGMYSELACRVGCRGHHAALIPLAAYHNRLAFERRI